jgi:hypothetical protein
MAKVINRNLLFQIVLIIIGNSRYNAVKSIAKRQVAIGLNASKFVDSIIFAPKFKN